MANPYGITEVSIPQMIGLDQQLKSNRIEQMFRQKQMDMQEKQWARQEKQDARDDKFRSDVSAAYDMTTGKIDPTKARGAYLQAGDVMGAVKFDSEQAQQRKAQLETASKNLEMTTQILGGVTDAASYANARTQAQSLGLDISRVPEQYDPAWVAQNRQQALSVKEQIDAELKKANFEEEKRHNKATEATAQTNSGIAAGNLALSRQREARVTKWGPQAIILGGAVKTGTDDLDY